MALSAPSKQPKYDLRASPTQTTDTTVALPEGWKLVRLGDHVRFLRHGTNSRAELTTDSTVKYLHYGDIHTAADVLLDPHARPMPRLPLDSASGLDRLEDGDLVLVDASEDLDGVGKSVEIAGVQHDFVVAGLHTIAVRFDRAVLADGYKAYLQFCPAFRNQLRRLAAGTKVFATNRSHIASVELPLPGVTEQHDIAEALSDADGLLGALETLIAKKRAIKQATMQHLLTAYTRLPGFSGEWETKRWGDTITDCFSGATPRRDRPEFYKGTTRWITSGELHYNLITDTAEKISDEAVAATHLTILPPGTFLMAITGLEAEGTRGACGIVGAPSATNQSCMAVLPAAGLLTEYLFHYYVFRGKPLALQYCQGTKQQSYTATLVRQLPIDLPPTIEEQAAIAVVLSDMDAEIAALEARRDKTRAIKQGMMQQLLTGRVRLVPADSPAT